MCREQGGRNRRGIAREDITDPISSNKDIVTLLLSQQSQWQATVWLNCAVNNYWPYKSFMRGDLLWTILLSECGNVSEGQETTSVSARVSHSSLSLCNQRFVEAAFPGSTERDMSVEHNKCCNWWQPLDGFKTCFRQIFLAQWKSLRTFYHCWKTYWRVYKIYAVLQNYAASCERFQGSTVLWISWFYLIEVS